MKVLVVSRNLPNDFRIKVHGVYQRLRMFLEGIQEISSIDILFYVSSDFQVSPSVVSQIRHSFLEHWKIDLNVILCPSQKFQKAQTFVGKCKEYLGSSMSLFNQPGYMETSGPKQVEIFEDCLNVQADAIFVDKLQSMCPLLLSMKRLPPVFLNMDDIEHVALLRSVNKMPKVPARLLSYARVPALVFGERRAACLAEKTFICSERDRKYLAKWGMEKVATIPNSVSIPEKNTLTEEVTLLFIGTYSYLPNVEAAEFLIKMIWPRVHQEMPDAKLIIAGANPEKISGYGDIHNGVEFPGFVENLEELYRRTRVVCAPILTGAGTRVKIIEAAAYGKPIVSTSLGAEGLDLCDGQELMLRNDAESFAAACLQLLQDMSLCERLGKAARARTILLYDKQNIIKLFQKYLVDQNK